MEEDELFGGANYSSEGIGENNRPKRYFVVASGRSKPEEVTEETDWLSSFPLKLENVNNIFYLNCGQSIGSIIREIRERCRNPVLPSEEEIQQNTEEFFNTFVPLWRREVMNEYADQMKGFELTNSRTNSSGTFRYDVRLQKIEESPDPARLPISRARVIGRLKTLFHFLRRIPLNFYEEHAPRLYELIRNQNLFSMDVTASSVESDAFFSDAVWNYVEGPFEEEEDQIIPLNEPVVESQCVLPFVETERQNRITCEEHTNPRETILSYVNRHIEIVNVNQSVPISDYPTPNKQFSNKHYTILKGHLKQPTPDVFPEPTGSEIAEATVDELSVLGGKRDRESKYFYIALRDWTVDTKHPLYDVLEDTILLKDDEDLNSRRILVVEAAKQLNNKNICYFMFLDYLLKQEETYDYLMFRVKMNEKCPYVTDMISLQQTMGFKRTFHMTEILNNCAANAPENLVYFNDEAPLEYVFSNGNETSTNPYYYMIRTFPTDAELNGIYSALINSQNRTELESLSGGESFPLKFDRVSIEDLENENVYRPWSFE